MTIKNKTKKDAGSIPAISTQFKSAYSPRNRVLTVTSGVSLTKQNHKQECDINDIVARHLKTGVYTHENKKIPQYGDFSSLDFQSSMNIVAEANSMFENLPAKVRSRFENDPAQLLSFIEDENNLEEMYELGLAEKQPETASDEPEKASVDSSTEEAEGIPT